LCIVKRIVKCPLRIASAQRAETAGTLQNGGIHPHTLSQISDVSAMLKEPLGIAQRPTDCVS
jgi:hypothetical protein